MNSFPQQQVALASSKTMLFPMKSLNRNFHNGAKKFHNKIKGHFWIYIVTNFVTCIEL